MNQIRTRLITLVLLLVPILSYSQSKDLILAQALVSKADEQNDIDNLRRTLPLISKIAKDGDADAQTMLGQMYLLGEEVKQDYPQAFFWYLKAANQGHIEAQEQLRRLGYGYSCRNSVIYRIVQ